MRCFLVSGRAKLMELSITEHKTQARHHRVVKMIKISLPLRGLTVVVGTGRQKDNMQGRRF